MTIRRFWCEPYCSAHETRIAQVDGAVVRLEESIFFAESGGQESDHGSIGGHPVRHAALVGAELLYTLDAQHGLVVGQAVRVEIDWARRYALMRLHFAAEIVLELACREFALADKIGAHIGADKARIDFASAHSVAPLMPALAQRAQAWIDADCAIETGFSDESALRRYWSVAGLAQVPCGGTHLRRTGEIGRVALKRRNIGWHKERIEIRLTP